MKSLSTVTLLGIFPERKSFVSYFLNTVLCITVLCDYHLYVKKLYLKERISLKRCSISVFFLYIFFSGILRNEKLQLLGYST